MRVPTNARLASFNETIGRLRSSQARALDALATGRKLQRPSDDPEGSARATTIRAELNTLAAMSGAAQHGRAALAAQETSLGAMEELIESAETLAMRGATDVLSTDARRAIATEVRQLGDALFAEGNRRHGGYSLFGGSRTTTDPFIKNPDGSWSYQGDSTVRQIDLDGVAHALNLPGSTALTDNVNAGAAIEALAVALEGGNAASVTATLSNLEDLRREVTNGRLSMGLELSSLDHSEAQIQSRVENLTVNLSDVEDADLTEVVSELSRLELYMNTNLGAASRFQERSLFDVLT